MRSVLRFYRGKKSRRKLTSEKSNYREFNLKPYNYVTLGSDLFCGSDHCVAVRLWRHRGRCSRYCKGTVLHLPCVVSFDADIGLVNLSAIAGDTRLAVLVF